LENGKQMSERLVSVVTPAYNAAHVLEHVIDSVARQTLPALEHIVIDDGSGDATAEILSRKIMEVPGLRTITQPRRGAAEARNAGIEVARGRYVAFLDSDDHWRPDKLARQIEFMEQQGSVFSYGDYECRLADAGTSRSQVTPPQRLTYADFLRGCPIGCLTVAYNQEVLGKRYMPHVSRGHDWGLWLELTRDGAVAEKYPGLEAIYHMRRGSLSKDKLRKARDVYRIYREQEGIGPVTSLRYLVEHSLRSFVG
jgi:teichuronic acid biosynthesis glycosyltransferase TuaG